MIESDTQPHCPCCQKPLAKQARTVYVRDRPPASGLDVSKLFRTMVGELHNKAECQVRSNMQVISVKYSGGRVSNFGEWDGVSYQAASGFFCSATCAQLFGQLAYHAGYRIRAKS